MKKINRWLFQPLLAVFLFLAFFNPIADAYVENEGNQTYLVDRAGERWDITQAVSIGFDPRHFEFGIGRHAFTPLGNTHWQPGSTHHGSRMRVIGVAKDGDAHAYSVRKLSYHETANTFLGPNAITAAY